MKLQVHFYTYRLFFGVTPLLVPFRFGLSQTSSYDVAVDPRGVSMGESLVAASANLSGLEYNPATLSTRKGVNVKYSQRSLNWSGTTKDIRYHSWDAAAQFKSTAIAFSYKRLSFGDIVQSTPSQELGEVSMYDHTFVLAAAHRFESGWSVGAAVKTFNFVGDVTRASNPEGYTFDVEKTLPILFDLGLLYDFSIIDMETVSDRLSFGMALQNFGSNFVMTSKDGWRTSQQLTRYFRTGFAYSITLEESEEALTPLRGVITAEYRKELNGFSSARSDFYGFGFDVTLFEIASVRTDWFLANSDWIYGKPGRPSMRHGFGLALPFSKVGTSPPLVLRLDYGAIPVNQSLSTAGLFTLTNRTLNLFSLAIQYEVAFLKRDLQSP